MADEHVGAGIDRSMREFNEKVRRVVVVGVCLERVIALMAVNDRDDNV